VLLLVLQIETQREKVEKNSSSAGFKMPEALFSK